MSGNLSFDQMDNFSNHTDSHDDQFCPDNLTFEYFGHTQPVPRQPDVYVALAVCHILFVLVPSVLLSSLAMYFLKKRFRKHPTNIIFYWICVDCIIGPCTYGLLLDLSFIFNQPILGRCEFRWEGAILWLCYACAITAYDFLLAFGAIAFYVTLKYNIRRFNLMWMNVGLAVIVVFAILVASIWLIIAEAHVSWSCRIHGSFCFTFFTGGSQTVAIVLEVIRIACALLPLHIIVIISVILYFLKVKSNVMKFDKNMMKSILRLFVVLSSGSMLWNIPTLVMHFGSFDGSQRGFIEMISTYTLQLNFVFFPLLVLFLNKDAVISAFFHVLDECLNFHWPQLCDDLCAINTVANHVQQSIRLREMFPPDELMTEHTQLEAAAVTGVPAAGIAESAFNAEVEVVPVGSGLQSPGSSDGGCEGGQEIVVAVVIENDAAGVDDPLDGEDSIDSLPLVEYADPLDYPGYSDYDSDASPVYDDPLEYADAMDYDNLPNAFDYDAPIDYGSIVGSSTSESGSPISENEVGSLFLVDINPPPNHNNLADPLDSDMESAYFVGPFNNYPGVLNFDSDSGGSIGSMQD